MINQDAMLVFILPKTIRDKTRQMSREKNQSESSILREGLMTVLNQWEFQKREQEMIRQF